MQTEIRLGIHQLALQASSLEDTNLYWGKADDDAGLPYTIISIVANPATRDTGETYEDFHLNFTSYDKELSVVEAIEAELIELFDYGESALDALLTNFKTSGIMRDFRESRINDQDRTWQNILRYRIMTEGA